MISKLKQEVHETSLKQTTNIAMIQKRFEL
jgi:hypothetical protein